MMLFPFEYDTGRNNFSLGDGLVLAVALTYAYRSLRGPVPLPRYAAYVVGLAVVAIASATLNVMVSEPFFSGTRATLIETSKLVMATLWMCVTFWLLSRRFARRFLQLAYTSILFGTAWAVGSIAMTVTEVTDARPSGPFDNANLYGGYLCFNAFLVLAAHGVAKAYVARERQPLPMIFRLLDPGLLPVCLPVLLLGVVSTGSRGALIGTAFGLALAGFWRPRSITSRRVLVLAGVLAALTVSLHWYLDQDPLVLERLRRTAEGDAKGVDERLMLWHAARDAFATHPVLGVGYGQFRNYAHLATGENKVAHQTYLSIAAELGVAGLVVFGCLVLAVLRGTLRPGQRPYPGVTLAGRGYVLATLVQGLFANVQHSRALWICIGVLAVQAAMSSARLLPRPWRAEATGRIWRPT
jgi:O-antigen ligase